MVDHRMGMDAAAAAVGRIAVLAAVAARTLFRI